MPFSRSRDQSPPLGTESFLRVNSANVVTNWRELPFSPQASNFIGICKFLGAELSNSGELALNHPKRVTTRNGDISFSVRSLFNVPVFGILKCHNPWSTRWKWKPQNYQRRRNEFFLRSFSISSANLSSTPSVSSLITATLCGSALAISKL